SSAPSRPRTSPSTSTASRSGRSSPRPGAGCPSTPSWKASRPVPSSSWPIPTAATPPTCLSRTSSTAKRGWRSATTARTSSPSTARFDVPEWPGHRAGQHVDVRLTAEDGYSAQRSYSIASAPGAEQLELTVVRIDDGEVSPYLTNVLDVGDQVELRGPIGGYF